MTRRNPARFLAPLALIAVVVVVIVVVSNSGVGDDGSRSGSTTTTPTETQGQDGRRNRQRRQRRTYVVRAGDSLVLISERTGVSVERLQELNPEIDPQALTPGQRIKLRE